MNNVYNLTGMTGNRSSEGRTAVIFSFEMPWRVVLVGMISLVMGLLLFAPFSLLLGQPGIMLVGSILSVGVGTGLFNVRQRSGLGLYHWQAVRDRLVGTPVRGAKGSGKRARLQFHHRDLQLYQSKVATLLPSSVPVTRVDETGSTHPDTVFGEIL